MHLTKRLLYLLIPLAIPIILATTLQLLLYIGGIYIIFILCLCTVDYLTNPFINGIEINRKVNSKFSLGVENCVSVNIINRTQHIVKLAIKDDFPDEFIYKDVLHSCVIQPSDEYQLTYNLTPIRRGIYQFGDLNVRCSGKLGLVVRQYKVIANTEIKVYPNLQAIREYELLIKRGMLHQIGLKSSRLFGEGTEMERLRDYYPDDDFRRIDWKATARHRKPIVREYETERSQDVIIMLDTGRLMATPVMLSKSDLPDDDDSFKYYMLKLDYAINTTLMTAYVSMLRGDKIGLLAFADNVHQYLSPKPGKKQFLTMLESTYALPVIPVEPDFESAFTYLSTKQRKRALIILFTDILDKDSAEGIAKYVLQFSKHHLVVCVTLADSGIIDLSKKKATDSKSVYQKAIAERLLQEKNAILEVLRLQGVIAIDVPAHQLTMTVINKYLELKAKSMI
ncbi:DUF58 domain-containing protein [Candidatus Poribacteria bacterium]|nr:DUF58 domain-containing protein [Candidatus Poribacteria bacterium]